MDTAVLVLIIVIIGVFFIGTLPYIIDTLRGKTKPNRVTWLFWSIPLLAVAAQYFDDSLTWASLPVFFAGFGPLCIFFASFVNPNAYWKLGKFDYFCGLFALITLIAYAATQDVFLAIFLGIIADSIAALPTLKKAYTNPETETVWPFFMGFVDNVLAFFVMERYDFVEMAFPIYFIVICLIFVFLLRSQLSFSLFKK